MSALSLVLVVPWALTVIVAVGIELARAPEPYVPRGWRIGAAAFVVGPLIALGCLLVAAAIEALLMLP